MPEAEIRLVVPPGRDMVDLLGQGDHLLKLIEDQFEAGIRVRGNEITIEGDPQEVQAVSALFTEMLQLLEGGQPLTPEAIDRSIDMLKRGDFSPVKVFSDVILTHRGKTIRPEDRAARSATSTRSARTRSRSASAPPAPARPTSRWRWRSTRSSARRSAASSSRVRRSRPGRSSATCRATSSRRSTRTCARSTTRSFDMMDIEKSTSLTERGVIEVAPLAFMRGRTLNDSFVVLDEAQNTSPEQMKMFLTRLGFGSKIVITGDVTQIDLPVGQSGLRQVRDILAGVADLEFVELESRDVVRHKLVQHIVTAYSRYDEARQRAAQPRPPAPGTDG